MAKFCGNCGAVSDDNANVCGNCGAPFATVNVGGTNDVFSKIPGVNGMKPEQKALVMKIAKFAIPAVAALVVVLVLVFAVIVPNTGARGALKKYFKAVQEGDSATIAEMLPAKYTSDELHGETYDPSDKMDKQYFENENSANATSAIEKKFGEGYKYKIKDMKIKKLDKDDLEDYEEIYDNLVDNHKDKDFEAPGISAGYKLKFELVLKGDKKDKDAKCTVYMIKEDGNWVVWSVDTTVPGADPLEVLSEPTGTNAPSNNVSFNN